MAHQCSVCLKMFTCPSKLQRHHLIHTGEKPFVCSVCGKAFRQAIHLKKHLETHTGNAPTNNSFPSNWEQPDSFSSDEPESVAYPTFQGKFSLTADVSLQSCGSSEVVELKERVQSEDYAMSLKANSEQPEFKLISPDSTVCTEWEYPHRNDPIKQMLQEFPVTFTGAGNAISNPDDVLQCAVCSKFCSSPCQLEKHLLVHSKVGTFECSICTQTFSQESEMKLHSQIHAQEDLPQVISDMSSSPGEVPQCNASKGNIKIKYQCPQCPRSFCSPSKLRRHCLTHTGQRPYYCLECGKSFRQLAHLKTHQNTHRAVQSVEASLYEDTAGASIFKDGNVDKYQLPGGEPPSLNYSLSLGLQSPDPLDSQQLASAGIPSNTSLTDRTFQMAKKQEGSIPVSEHTNEWNSEEDSIFVKAGFHGGSIKNSDRSVWKPFECIECGQTFSEAANFQNHCCESTEQDEFAHQGEGMEGNSSLSVESPEETTSLWDSDRKMNSQSDNINELDLNIIIKQENWPSLNKEDVSTPNGIACDSEFQLQPALGYTKIQQKELTRSSHQCNTCLKYFATPYKLRRHVLIHTGQKPFSCRVCGKRFRQRAHLVLHNRTHFRPEQIKQKRTKSNSRPSSIQIGYDYDSSGSLLKSDVSTQINIPESVGSKEPVLVSTEMNVPLINTLDQNSVIYDQSLGGKRKASFRKHQCSLCFKCFSCPSKLQRHHLIHTGQKPFRCSLCEKTFSQAIHLKVHQRTHSKRMPFGSAFLQKRLVNAAVSDLPTLSCQEKDSGPVNATSENAKAELAIFCENNGSVELEDRHSNSNGDLRSTLKESASTKQSKFQLMSNNSVNECEEGKKKAYQCTTCMECFFTPFKLRRHVLTHTGLRPFSCKFCGKKFRQHAHMKFHICAHNQPRFSQQTENVKNNLLSVQKVEFHSVSSEAAINTILIPQHFEPEKPLGIKRASSATGLLQNTSPREMLQSRTQYQCLICLKFFSCPSKLERHHLIHTGQKPFRCVLCGKTFRQAIHLKVHQRTHNNRRPLERASMEEELVNTDTPRGSGSSVNQGQCIISSSPVSDMMTSGCSQEQIKETNSNLDVYRRASEINDVNTIARSSHHDTFKESEDWCHGTGLKSTSKKGKMTVEEFQLQLQLPNNINEHQTLKSKTYQCLVCLKSFSTPTRLQRHSLIHREQRPYSRHVCGKKFHPNSRLKYHGFAHFRSRTTLQKRTTADPDPFSSHFAECDHVSPVTTFESDISAHSNGVLEQEKHLDLNILMISPSERGLNQNGSISSQRTKSQPKHQCFACSKCFSCPSKLQRHLLIHTGQKPFRCLLCGKTFRQAIHLKVHQQTHNKWRSLKKASPEDRLHARNKNASGGGECLRGSSSFQEQHSLTSAISVPQIDVIIPDCSQQEMVKGPDVDCKINAQLYGPVNTIAVQIDQGTDTLPGALFPNKDHSASIKNKITRLTKKARLVVTGNKNVHRELKRKSYQCSACVKCFCSPSKLHRHTLSHTGQRPFSCHVCGKRFRQQSHVKLHLLTHNRPGISPQKTFTDSDRFSLHRNLVESVPAVTNLESDFALQHMAADKRTDVPLEISLPLLTSAAVLDNCSVLDYGKKVKHQCLICFKFFTSPSKLKRHNLIHTGLKPYQCVLCGKTFRQSIHLKVHQQTHNKWRAFRRTALKESISSSRLTEQDGAQSIANGVPQRSSWLNEGFNHLSGKEAKNTDICVGGSVLKEQNPSSVKQEICQKEIDCGLEVDFKHNLALNLTASVSSTHSHEYSPKTSAVIDPNESNIRNPLSPKNVDTVGDNFEYQKGDSERDMLSLNGCVQKSIFQDCISVLPTTQDDEPNSDRFSTVDQEDSDCVIIESNDETEMESISLQHGNGNSEISSSLQKDYQCPECSEYFSSLSQLQHHSHSHAENKLFKCPVCSKEFKLLTLLNAHQCRKCNLGKGRQSERRNSQKFPASNQSTHFSSVDPDITSWHPPIIDNSSDNMNLQNMDMSSPFGFRSVSRVHPTRKAYQCSVCIRSFESPYKLSRHFLIHTVGKSFQCTVCNKSFRQLCHLQNHKRTHRQKIFRAMHHMDDDRLVHTHGYDSQNLFSEGNALNTLAPQEEKLTDALHGPGSTSHPSINHNLTLDNSDHSTEMESLASGSVGGPLITPDVELKLTIKPSKREHKCSECQKSFSCPSKLERHFLIHAGGRPFKCSVCGKAFRQAAHLKVHGRLHSKMSENISLTTFSREKVDGGGNGHDLSHNQMHAMVDIPVAAFNDCVRNDLGARQESRVAGVEVALESEHGDDYWCEPLEEPFTCKACDQSFADERSLQMHGCPKGQSADIQSSFYQCAICFKNFKSPSKLRRHYVIHTGERPFKCSICRKTFTQSGHLKTHQLSHKQYDVV